MNKCLFCDESFYIDKLIFENEYWRSVYDGFPCSKGHSLIIPKRHIQSFFELNDNELKTLYHFIKTTKEIIEKEFKPLAYNLGINDGFGSGQTIPHLHIHLIPRYENDGGLPCGVRNVFPQDIAKYTK